MYRALWYFLIYAFLGWCAEVCFAAANEGKFVNRGFLNGPVCPIYGFGMLLVIHYLTPLQDKPLILFAGSVFLTSLIELVGGWILKKLFHQAWWDYSDVPFNLGGYVCLKFSLLWGLGCMLVMDLVQPLVVTLVGVAVGLAGRVCLATLLLLLGIDAAATVQSIAKLNRQLRQLDDIAAKLKEISNEIG
ncbi:MAG: putative ABC transporter permease, partial [Oscillospiraceae bacterium]